MEFQENPREGEELRTRYMCNHENLPGIVTALSISEVVTSF